MLLAWPRWQNTDDGIDSHMFSGRMLDILEQDGYTVVGDAPEGSIRFAVTFELRQTQSVKI